MLQGSIFEIADALTTKTKSFVQSVQNEEELRIGFEKILEPVGETIVIKTPSRYERLGARAKTIYRGRSDTVHGQVIIECKSSNAFSADRAVSHTYDQLIDYMAAEIQSSGVHRMIGVRFHGCDIFLVRYQGGAFTGPFLKDEFIQEGPYPFNVETARTLLTYLRALSRLPLTAENLVTIFGPQGGIAPLAVSDFLDALEYWSNEKVLIFFEEWKLLFGIIYGEQLTTVQQEQATILSQFYRVGKETDFQELLFSVHPYFALVMKLISAELLVLKEIAFGSSFSRRLTHCVKEELRSQLENIEDGGIYSRQDITNFLEGDFFRWYLDAFSPRLEEAIREVARGISEFEPATSSIEPETTRDLLKKLYQYLVPSEVRHNLGEYYTPDWLAELLLNEVDYNGNTLKRLLDPAGGSGTFLVLAIQQAKEYGREHKEAALEKAKRINANIWGFDLNPLAVIATRTNYLFALGDLVLQLPAMEIPIYLADSVLWPERSGQTTLNFAGRDHAKVTTSKTVALFALDDENGTHYLCTIINSAPIREFVKSYSSAGKGVGAPSVMNHIGITKFDPQNEFHKKLVQTSIKLHELKVKNSLDKISEFEQQSDKLVKKLFGLSDEYVTAQC